MMKRFLPVVAAFWLFSSAVEAISACSSTAKWHPTVCETQGGSIADGLDVASIRYGAHDGYERLVFDITQWEGAGPGAAGKPAASSGYFHIMPGPSRRQMIIELGGFRAFSAAMPSFGLSWRINSLQRLRGEAYEDDSTVALALSVSSGSCYRAFALQNPARIVIDIRACIER